MPFAFCPRVDQDSNALMPQDHGDTGFQYHHLVGFCQSDLRFFLSRWLGISIRLDHS